jgi:hypothetical protein
MRKAHASAGTPHGPSGRCAPADRRARIAGLKKDLRGAASRTPFTYPTEPGFISRAIDAY